MGFWSGVFFGLIGAWLCVLWLELLVAAFLDWRDRSSRTAMFRCMERSASQFARKLSESEKAMIRQDLFR